MRPSVLQDLPYHRDSGALVQQCAALPGLAFLDSGLTTTPLARYDILSALPDVWIEQSAPQALADAGLADLRRALDAHAPRAPLPCALAALPFTGGMIGMLGYEGAIRAGLYSWAIVVDHEARTSTLFFLPECPSSTVERVRSALKTPPAPLPPFVLSTPLHSNFTPAQYAEAFARIQDYIHAGDCYQVNLAQRFSAGFHGSPLSAYLRLRQAIHSPFGGYFQGTHEAVLSYSPERFLQVSHGEVLTQPIKGTRRRATDGREDAALARELETSEKDRAENLMIVDLLRNDLGTLCTTGSIRVDALFALQSFSNVHHLVSSIRGTLPPAYHALDLLAKCFPGGSITGAPKRRAMEIIAELEPDPRQAYCGTLFYATHQGQLDANILIRSLVCADGQVRCWGGGGIVADSACAQEYQECFDKINNIIRNL